MLRVDPKQRGRLIEIARNLAARVSKARHNGWLGEVEGLQFSLAAAEAKLASLDRTIAKSKSTNLGMPLIRASLD